MGNQTTVIIRNDAIGEIRDNPEQFVEQLLQAIEDVSTYGVNSGRDFPTGTHGNVARVIEVHHADSTVVIAAGGSTGYVLGQIYRWSWPSMKEMCKSIHQMLSEFTE